MFRPERHPLTSSLLLLAYLTAGTASGLLHDHVHHELPCAVVDCGHHEHETDAHDDHDAWATTHDSHDDCVVCRFLGQRVMPAEVGQVACASDRTIELVAHWHDAVTSSIPRTTHSRAPPLLG